MAGVSSATRLMDDSELMRRLLAKYTLKECAALLNVTYHTVCRRARRPEFLSQLKELDSQMYTEVDQELRAMTGLITNRVVEMSSVALDKLEALLTGENTEPRLMARVAMDILDRNTETSKSTKSFVKTEHAFMNPGVLAAAAKAAREMDETVCAPILDQDTET